MFSRLSIHAFIPLFSGASSDGSAMSSIFVKPWKDSPLGVWSWSAMALGRFSRPTTRAEAAVSRVAQLSAGPVA